MSYGKLVGREFPPSFDQSRGSCCRFVSQFNILWVFFILCCFRFVALYCKKLSICWF